MEGAGRARARRASWSSADTRCAATVSRARCQGRPRVRKFWFESGGFGVRARDDDGGGRIRRSPDEDAEHRDTAGVRHAVVRMPA